jgi:1-acyl-sn-glycerol-3-phosphate acyltransferase
VDHIVRLAERTYADEIDIRLRAVHTTKNEAGFDPFGFDPDALRPAAAFIAFLHRTYFRTQCYGLEHVPHGRALFVANHSGQLPLDGVLIGAALFFDLNPPLVVRSMVEKWAQKLPFFSVLFPRLGQVLGAPENARRLLEADHPLLVFPEGARGISKPFQRRYQLEGFGLGFMRLAMETRTPIVPVGVIGAEEQYPAVGNWKGLARALGMPALPVLPQLFLGMPMPLPTRYRLHFGEPLRFEGNADDEDVEIEWRVSQVRDAVQGLLQRGLAARDHVFW